MNHPRAKALNLSGSADEDSFADLEFLSDEERKELDTPETIEEIFYLGDEESATVRTGLCLCKNE